MPAEPHSIIPVPSSSLPRAVPLTGGRGWGAAGFTPLLIPTKRWCFSRSRGWDRAEKLLQSLARLKGPARREGFGKGGVGCSPCPCPSRSEGQSWQRGSPPARISPGPPQPHSRALGAHHSDGPMHGGATAPASPAEPPLWGHQPAWTWPEHGRAAKRGARAGAWGLGRGPGRKRGSGSATVPGKRHAKSGGKRARG